MKWEKIFSNNVAKFLISKTYKQLIQLHNKTKTIQSINGQRFKQKFLLRRHTDGQQEHAKMFNTVNYLRKAIKTTICYHLKPFRWPSLKSLQIKNFGEGVEEIEPSCTVGENITQYSHSGKQCGGQSYHMIQQSLFRAYTQSKL